jgi:hypothetical protein
MFFTQAIHGTGKYEFPSIAGADFPQSGTPNKSLSDAGKKHPEFYVVFTLILRLFAYLIKYPVGRVETACTKQCLKYL